MRKKPTATGGRKTDTGRSNNRPGGDRDRKPFKKEGEGRPGRSFGEDKPKRSFGDDKPKRPYGTRGDDSGKPKRPYGTRSDDKPKRSYGDDKPKRSFDGDRDDRPKRSFGDDKPKRSFGNDRDDKPKRPYGGDRDDKPKRSFGDRDDKPKRSFGNDRDDKPKRSYGDRDDKPKRSFGNNRDDRPKRSFGNDRDDKPKRSFGDRDDKPKRSFGNRDDKPKRPYGSGDRDDKPKRSYGDRDDIAKRSFGNDRDDRPKRSFGDDKPKRPYGSSDRDDKPKRSFDNDRDDRPKRSFGNDRDDKPKRSYGDRDNKPKRSFGDKKPTFSKPENNDFDKPYPLGSRKVSGPFRKQFEEEKKQGSTDNERSFKSKKSREEGAEIKEMTLNKYIAYSGQSSRRDAAELVKQGKVKVNGELALDPGYRVQPFDEVTIAGKKLTPQKGRVYILLNKPKGYITTTEDPEGRRTVMELVEEATQDRLFPVGRLDRNTTGLLLLTNDGDLAQKLSHPSYEIKKVYQVSLNKALTRPDFDKIVNGLMLEDGEVKVDEIAYLEEKTDLGLEIHNGRNRIVRRIFESLGYEVEKLDRVMYAGLTKKNLPRGTWRFLEEKEIILLKHFKS